MTIEHPEIGVCGLSCRLCPSYHSGTENRCGGCKSEWRMKAGCSFITCAVKRKGIEFCWQCPDHGACEKWRGHREKGRAYDSFVCYQRLEDNIAFIGTRGIPAFVEDQKERERLLRTMLAEFNEGRSKSFYCVVATVMSIEELRRMIAQARDDSEGKDLIVKSKILHLMAHKIAEEKNYNLKLRKKPGRP
jgi:hypothetical protein